jgi:group I intron endonuclease
MSIIYKVTNKLNLKVYIGKAVCSLKQRKYGHKRSATRGSPSHFHNAIRKYGFEQFTWEILFNKLCSDEELELQEKEFIKKFASNNRKFGYNMTEGGEGGNTLSNHPNKANIIKKLSAALKGRTKTVYKLISPQGEEIMANGLNEICAKYQLSRSHLITIAKNKLIHNKTKLIHSSGRKHHKGWKCEYLTNPQY